MSGLLSEPLFRGQRQCQCTFCHYTSSSAFNFCSFHTTVKNKCLGEKKNAIQYLKCGCRCVLDTLWLDVSLCSLSNSLRHCLFSLLFKNSHRTLPSNHLEHQGNCLATRTALKHSSICSYTFFFFFCIKYHKSSI